MIAFNLIVASLLGSIAASENSPLAFFTEIDGYFQPLSSIAKSTNGQTINVLTQGTKDQKANEFSMNGDNVMSLDSSTPDHLGFVDNKVAFGPNIPKEPLIIKDNKVTNHEFYLCHTDTKVYELTYGDLHNSLNTCFWAQLYLLPYDRETNDVAGASGSEKELTEEDLALGD